MISYYLGNDFVDNITQGDRSYFSWISIPLYFGMRVKKFELRALRISAKKCQFSLS